MTKTPEQQREHDEACASCVASLKTIGRVYGRLIMRKVIGYDLDVSAIDAGLDAALADTREFLVENGIGEDDVEISMGIVRAAIIAEGKTIAVMLPDDEGSLH